MTPVWSRLRATPEAAGYGFVLGVVGGASLDGSLTEVACSAFCGAVILAVVRRYVPTGSVARLLADRTRQARGTADIPLI